MALEIKDFLVRQGIVVQGTNAVTSSTSNGGALQVNSGAGIAKNLIVGTTATIWGPTDLKSTLDVGGNVTLVNLTATGIVSLTNSQAATTGGNGALRVTGGIRVNDNLVVMSSAASTGTAASNALYVQGGVGIANSLVVEGATLFKNQVTFSGTATFVFSTQTFYTDNILNLHVPPGGIDSAWTLDDGKDIGLKFHYYTNSADAQAALVLANDTKFLEWYNAGAEGTNTFAESSYGIFKTGGIRLVDTAASFSTSTGALQVLGGIASGNVYAATTVSATTLVGRTLTSGRVALVGVGGSITDDESLTYDPATNILSATVTVATTATNIAGGARGTIFFQTSTGITVGLPIGSAGNVLTVDNGIPSWKPVSETAVGSATTASNLASGTTNQVPYQISPGVTGFYGPGTAGQILLSAGTAAGGPVYTNTSSVYVNSAVNAQTLFGGTSGQLVFQVGAGITSFTGPGTAGQLIISNGTSGPAYVNTSTFYVGSAVGSDNLRGGTAGAVPYQTGAGATTFLTIGAAGTFLMSTGSAPSYVTTASMYVGTAVNADRIKGGTTGQLVYQSAAGVTAFAGPGTAGQLLVSGGAAIPVYTNTGSIHVGAAQYAVTATNVEGGATGNIVYQTAAGRTSFMSVGSAGGLLQSNGTTSSFVSTTTLYVGDANFAVDLRGGTANSIVWQRTANDTDYMSMGAAGSVLQSNGTTATFVTTASLYVNSSVFSEDLRGGTTGQLVYQSAANTTDFMGPGTSGQILVSAGAAVPVYTNTASIFVGNATISTNVRGGTAGQLVYQSGVGTTTFAGPGTAGQLLVSGGTGAPTYTNTGSIHVGAAQYSVTATNIAGGVAGSIFYQTAAGVTTSLPIGTVGQVLAVDVTNVPEWLNASETSAGLATTATNLAGGFQYAIPVQSASGITAYDFDIRFDTGSNTLRTFNAAFTGTTVASSVSAAAVTVVGGVGIAQNLIVGTTLAVTGSSTFANVSAAITTATALTVTGPSTLQNVTGVTGTFTNLTVTGASNLAGVTATGVVLVTNTVNASSTNTGALQVGGGAGIHLDLVVGSDITVGPTVASAVVPAIYTNNALLATYTSGSLAAATLYSLDTFAVASYTSAKYFIQLKSTTKVHVTEISLFHNGTDVYLNEYGMAFSVDSLGVFDATISGGNVVLQVTPTYAATTVKVVRMSITA